MKRDVTSTLEDLEFLDSTGVGALEAHRRADFPSSEAMEKWLDRNGRHDLWLSMKNRDPEGVHSKQARRLTSVADPQPDALRDLLRAASQSPKARTRSKANRIQSLIADLEATLSAEQEESALRERARKDVERLERQLAEAKARLRGGKASGPGVSASALRAWAKKHGVDCPPRGRIPGAVREAFEAAEGEAS